LNISHQKSCTAGRSWHWSFNGQKRERDDENVGYAVKDIIEFFLYIVNPIVERWTSLYISPSFSAIKNPRYKNTAENKLAILYEIPLWSSILGIFCFFFCSNFNTNGSLKYETKTLMIVALLVAV
jgi:hypothetical protein